MSFKTSFCYQSLGFRWKSILFQKKNFFSYPWYPLVLSVYLYIFLFLESTLGCCLGYSPQKLFRTTSMARTFLCSSDDSYYRKFIWRYRYLLLRVTRGTDFFHSQILCFTTNLFPDLLLVQKIPITHNYTNFKAFKNL